MATVSVLAAALTPLRAGGDAVDAEAVAPYVDFLAGSGVDGVFVLGTTGEGILLSATERELVTARFLAAARGRLRVLVHCGAQTTADTVRLCADAAAQGADGVAVIAPPYFDYDEEALHRHFAAAAAACQPLPFHLYEFADRSGYAIPLAVVARLRETAPNLAGIKVSDAPWGRFAPYVLEGLAIHIGPEALITRGLRAGAAGVVSGLAAAFPELVVELAQRPDADRAARLTALRRRLQRLPLHAALKHAVAARGVPLRAEVRAPLRPLDAAEAEVVDGLLAELSPNLRGSAARR